MPKNLSASGGFAPRDQGLCPWTPLGALPHVPPTFKLLPPPLVLSELPQYIFYILYVHEISHVSMYILLLGEWSVLH